MVVESGSADGRGQEIAELTELLAETQAGHSAVAVLDGESGIGKSHLLRAVIADAERAGVVVGFGHGEPLEDECPFAVVHQVFTGLLEDQPDHEQLVSGAGRMATTIIDGVAAEMRGEPQVAGGALHALHGVLLRLAERGPVMLVVDDAHLADTPSLRYLAYAARRLTSEPVLVVLAVTTGEPVVAEACMADLARHARRIHLEGLASRVTAELVRQALGGQVENTVTAACHRATGGNPFLLAELLAAVRRRQRRAPGPLTTAEVAGIGGTTVAESLRRRLRPFPDAAAVATAVAILGQDATLDLAAAMTGLDRAVVVDQWDRLVRMKVLRDAWPPAFTHSLVRNAVLSALPAGTRVIRHADAAAILHETGAPASRVATHLLQAGPPEPDWAVPTLRQAADQALATGAPETAATYLRHAATAPMAPGQRAELLRELGEAHLAHDLEAGVACLRDALEAATTPVQTARAALSLAPALISLNHHDEARAITETALATLDPDDTDMRWRLTHARFTATWLPATTTEHAEEWERRLTTLVPADPTLQAARAGFIALHQSRRGHERDDSVAAATATLTHPGRHQRAADQWGLYPLINADELGVVQRYCRSMETVVLDGGLVRTAGMIMMFRGTAARVAGDLADAEVALRTALGLFADWCPGDTDYDAMHCRGQLLAVLVDSGQYDQAHELLTSHGLLGTCPHLLHYHWILLARGRLRLATGEIDQGLADLNDCGRRARLWDIRNPVILPWRYHAALAHSTAGDRDTARELAEEDLDAARRWGTARAIGSALHALGCAIGDRAEAAATLTQAVNTLHASPARYLTATALLDLAIVRRGQGDRDETTHHLHAAAALAEACGATALTTRINEELRATGARPLVPAQARRTSLTTQEQRTAELAADGRTNKQIAAHLHVSLRCVEMHLSSVYRKLGITGRRQLRTSLPSATRT
ncbi:ATP-binding protein [Amycolatopsis sp. NPDC059021]|uniref:ATP-binding protein n=1 Tax=Amycolatopsis sp. NPDC059021 TaxID=3346704 RepID=UPI00366C1C3F